MILAVLMINQHGKPRLSRFYDNSKLERQQYLLTHLYTAVTSRDPATHSNIIDGSNYFGEKTRIVYRSFATLYFIVAHDESESELGILTMLQSFIEALNYCFDNVCELDLIFNFDKVNYLLDEMIVGGLVSTTDAKTLYERAIEHDIISQGKKLGSANNILMKCGTCYVAFETLQDLKDHHKCQWHRYNMKRKVSGFSVVDEETFHRKMSLLSDSHNLNVKGTKHLKRSPQSTSSAQGAKNPQVHNTKVKDLEPLTCLDSFFDTKKFSTVQENIHYMTQTYSLFIPDRTHVKDLPQFMTYLAHKLYYGHQCLFCNRSFQSLSAVRKHMIDKGHTSIGMHTEEDEEELLPFYNNDSESSSDYPDDQSSEESNSDLWEAISDSSTLHDVPHNSYPRTAKTVKRASKLPYINEVGNLVLPRGKEVVHRALAYIYRQHFASQSRDPSVRLMLLEQKQKRSLSQLHPHLSQHTTKLGRRCLRHQQCDSLRRQLCLGLKTNRLQKTILRQNKYFL